jgi:polar amino acid transport system permease protein
MTSLVELAARQRLFFRLRVCLVWLALLILVGLFFRQFDLDYTIIFDKLPYIAGLKLTKDGFIQGAALTLFLCLVSTAGALALGLMAAIARLSTSAVAIGISSFYISFFRGTPLLVQILLIYLGLPQLGPVPDAIPCGIIALALNYGAYMSEIFRAGILSVPPGQREAATSLGLSRLICFWKVILPQAMRVIVPPAGSQFIAMLKDSSLVSAMGVWEILFLSQSYARSSFHYIEMLLTAAVIYWILSIGLEFGQSKLERHYRKGFAR